MTDVNILIEGGRGSFRPGDTVRGSAEWSLDRAPKSVEARLYWRGEGRGGDHVEMLRTVAFENPGPRERRSFQFVLPRGPYSFEGRLMSLTWGVEFVVEKKAWRSEFAMAPGGKPVQLHDDPTADSEERSTPK